MKGKIEIEDADVRLRDLLRPREQLELLDVFLSRGPWPVTESDLAHLTTLAEDEVSTRLEPLCDLGLVEDEHGEYWLNGDSVAGSALQDARDNIFNSLETIDSSTEDRYPEEDAWVVGSPFVELFRQEEEMMVLGALLDSDSGTVPRVLTKEYRLGDNQIDPRATLLDDVGIAEVADGDTVATDHLQDGDVVDRGYRLSDNSTAEALRTAVETLGEPREEGFYCRVDDTTTVTTVTVDSESQAVPDAGYGTDKDDVPGQSSSERVDGKSP